MSAMMALVFAGPGRMAVEARPRPQAGPGDVVVSISAAGICGSELTSFTGESARRAPGLVFGHEVAGTVTAVGEAVSPALVDSRVAVNPLVPCRRCPTCLAGRTNVCPARTLLGMHLDGGFAEEVAVPAAAVHPLGDLDDVGGSLVEPVANAVHAVGLLPAVIGREILVLGAGAIGLSVISVLRVAGARRISVIDPVAHRREQALAAGAHRALAPDDDALHETHPGHVVDAVGVTSSRREAIARCADGGCVVLLGMHAAESELPINAAVGKELRLQCSYAYTEHDFELALGLLQSGAISYRAWITELRLDQGQAAFEALVDRPAEVTKVILRPPRGVPPGERGPLPA
jgi:2-desacetyl-2-hydroxyethyl bacteriochlorophyllide A dehydrogenase